MNVFCFYSVLSSSDLFFTRQWTVALLTDMLFHGRSFPSCGAFARTMFTHYAFLTFAIVFFFSSGIVLRIQLIVQSACFVHYNTPVGTKDICDRLKLGSGPMGAPQRALEPP
jgi:hypothetical protein